MDESMKRNVSDRLRRIEGQVRGVLRMVEEDRYCMDILAQTRSVASALRKVEDLVMENHLQTCVKEAMRSDDNDRQEEIIEEVMTVLSGMRKHG